MGDIKVIFLDILLPKAKPIFVTIIYRPPNNIIFLECLNNHLNDDKHLDNKILLLGYFNINFFTMGNILSKK